MSGMQHKPASATPAPTQAAPAVEGLATADAQSTLGNAAIAEQLAKSPAVGEGVGQIGALGGGAFGKVDGKGQPIVTHEVHETITETISNAPDPYGAWNGTFTWDSNFALVIDPNAHTLTIQVRIHTGASDDVKKKWEAAIEGKWGGKYSLVVAGAKDKPAESYKILCDLQFVDDAKDAHYEVTANTPGADEGGRAGLGGTTSMTGWGTEDTTDVTHEFGHMLGAPEDYFTTDGHDHTDGGKKDGFRDDGGGIMNNPADDPFVAHYDLVRRQAAKALGVPEASCTVG